MKKKITLLTIAVMLFATEAFTQTTKTWTGATSTSWNLAGNWNPVGIPIATDNVIIPTGTTNSPTVSGSTGGVCNNLTVNSGATLTISATSGSSTTLTVGGTATFNGALSIGGYVLGNTGKMVAANVIWSSTSSITTYFNSRCEVSGNWTFASGSNVNMGFCAVTFTGTNDSQIFSYSVNSSFGSVTFGKTTTATTSVGTGSNATLKFSGTITINTNNTFACGVNITTIAQNNIIVNGRLNFYSGTLRLERSSGIQQIQMAAINNRVHSLVINCGGSVTLNNRLEIAGNLTIESGVFNPQDHTITVSGNWSNLAGPDNFTEGSGKVVMLVFFNKDAGKSIDQYINHSEHFNILEINNAYGHVIINNASAVVSCNKYQWTAGGLKVQAGTFTASDLIQNGISGYWGLQAGGTINLTKVNGFVDLNNATLNISGGTFTVYGGTDDSYWPFNNPSSITMSGGTLYFAETGIRINNTPALTYSITGGIIKTAHSFTCFKSGFVPTGGIIELTGAADANLDMISGSALHQLQINKSITKAMGSNQIRIHRETGKPLDDGSKAQNVSLMAPVTLNSHFQLSAGTFTASNHTITVKGNWTNNAGTGSFIPGIGRVIFNGGNFHQYCSNETFFTLEVNKPLGGALRMNGTSVVCSKYDWTAGAVDVLNNGAFTAGQLLDNGIAGNFYLNAGCTINLTNLTGNVDLVGNLFIYGGTFNVNGGINPSWWPGTGNASITMSGGVLNFVDQSIVVKTDPTFTLTQNISGGTIRTPKDFTCGRSDFNPSGGKLELYGSAGALLTITAGNLHELTINKSAGVQVTLNSNATVNGTLTVHSGILQVNNKVLTTAGNLAVNNGGNFWLSTNSQLKIAASRTLSVNSGGLLRVLGSAGNEAVVTRNGASGFYNINIMSGGTVAASRASFYYVNPLRVYSGATVDVNNPFHYCKFQHCSTGMLRIDNSQDLMLRNVEFLTPASGYNVSKRVSSGKLNFRDASGDFSGGLFEDDDFNRIDWTFTQPGLWTGAVSSDWWHSDNWDDFIVPGAGTNVTIPANASNMLFLDAGNCECNNLTVNGTITFAGAYLTVYGNLDVHGTLAMTIGNSQLTVNGNVVWNTASVGNIVSNGNILVGGNWYFNEGSNVQITNGRVYFQGNQDKWIRNHSTSSHFNSIYVTKTGGAQIGFSDLSTKPLRVNGSLRIFSNAKFASDSDEDILLKGDLLNDGVFQCNAGALKLTGVNHTLKPNVNDYFKNLVFAQSGNTGINTALTSAIQVKGNLHIDSGIFQAGHCTIRVGGGWNNNAGTDAFVEDQSLVIFNGGNYHQYIVPSENFNKLEVNKPLGGAVRIDNNAQIYCAEYDWTAGAVDVISGSFTAPGLADHGIAGNFYVNPGGTITLGNMNGYPHLKGNLFINGGTFNIIAPVSSQWPGNGNASITMTGGKLNVFPSGIVVANNPPYTFTTSITGGIIRTEGSFENYRSDFNPTAGTIELYGTGQATLASHTPSMGIIYNVIINKNGADNSGSVVNLESHLLVGGSLDVKSGTLNCLPGYMLVVAGDADVRSGGMLVFNPNTSFRLYGGSQVSIHEGGTFQAIGTESEPIVVDHFGTGFYDFGVSGTISTRYTTYNHCGNLIVSPTGFVDPQHAFRNCTFPVSIGSLLAINNSQNITIVRANFPYVPNTFNVKKLNDSGRIIMAGATGPGAGEAYEYDPNNRLDWRQTYPHIWSGAVSDDWHTAANWEGEVLPDETVDARIPASPPGGYMPVIQQDASCRTLLVQGNLTILDQTLALSEDLWVYGQLNVNYTLVVAGTIYWQSGSSANAGANSHIYCSGDWRLATGAHVDLNDGLVVFSGTSDSKIVNWTFGTRSFNKVSVSKMGQAKLIIPAESSRPLTFNGQLIISPHSVFQHQSDQVLTINSNIHSLGAFQCDAGTIRLNGTAQVHNMSDGNYFHNLEFNQSSFVLFQNQFSNDLTIKNDLIINSGVFRGGENIIRVGRDWNNYAGAGAFIPQNSRVVFNGNNPVENQLVYGNTTFNILELNQHPDASLTLNDGSTISVSHYDWTSGTLAVQSGNLLVYDLMDNRIAGNWILHQNGTISLYDETAVGLGGNITILGGYFTAYGGQSGISYWPYNANASLTMSGGTLDFLNTWVIIEYNRNYAFTSNITGGLIKTNRSFYAKHPGFQPLGGTVEILGESDGFASNDFGASYYNLKINKSVSNALVGLDNLVVTNKLEITRGHAYIFAGSHAACKNFIAVTNGLLTIYENTDISLGNAAEIIVGTGGQLKCLGLPDNEVRISGLVPNDYYKILVEAGGSISAERTRFKNLDETGVFVDTGATVDIDGAFNNCRFVNGKTGPFPLLTINTQQDLVLANVEFSGTGRGRNVSKWANSGSLTFVDALGNLAGSVFELDPYNRIHWLEQEASVTGIVFEEETLCKEAFQTLVIENLIVEAGATAHLIAGQSILFLPGTHIKSGAYMHARISNAWGFCENLPALVAVDVKDIEMDEVKSVPGNLIETGEDSQKLAVFPNPTTGKFTICQLKEVESEHFLIEIYNLPGELLMRTEFSDGQMHDFDITGWKPGMYLMKVHRGNVSDFVKLIKQ